MLLLIITIILYKNLCYKYVTYTQKKLCGESSCF